MEKNSWIDSLREGYPLWLEQLQRRMRQVELDEAYDKEVIASLGATDRARAKRVQANTRRIKARELWYAERAKAEKERQANLRLQAIWRRTIMENERQKQDAEFHDVSVPDDVEQDIVRDIRWVYDHWSDLFVQSDTGQRLLDTDILEDAPSRGAVAMANYALSKPDGFFDRFVIKLLPKDAGASNDGPDDDSDNKLAELDPSFEEMKDFFDMPVEGERVKDIGSSDSLIIEDKEDDEDDEW